ncbi:MAG: hypothetical protein ACE5NP_10660 [Anaerolineae bacterium]
MVVLLLLLNVIRGLIYTTIIPPWQGPDEIAHFEHTRLLYEKGRVLTPEESARFIRTESIPLHEEVFTSMFQFEFWRYAHHQPALEAVPQYIPVNTFDRPSLSYVLGALFFAPLHGQDLLTQLYGMRLLQVGLGTLVVWIAFLTARELFPENAFLILGVPAFIVFLPMHSHINGLVSDGNLAEVEVSLLIYYLVKVLKDGLSLVRTGILCSLVILGLLTKVTAFLVVPLMLTGLLIYAWPGVKGGHHWPLLLGSVACVLAIGLGAWLLNFPALALAGTFEPAMISNVWLDSQRYSAEAIRQYVLLGALTFASFWGLFGAMNVRLAYLWYKVLGGISLASIVGLLIWLMQLFKHRQQPPSWQRKSMALLLACVVFAVVPLFLLFVLYFDRVGPYAQGVYAQGRYVFPAIVPIAVLFLLGVQQLIPPQRSSLSLSLLVGAMFLFDAMALVNYVIPYYYS